MQSSSHLKLTPYWWEEAPLQETELSAAATLPSSVDVAIIGAGYSGLTAALILARSGRSVAVLDAQRFGEGASTRNGGMCSGNLKLSFEKLENLYGLSFAKTIYGEGIAARQSLANLIQTEDIKCHFQMTGRYSGANRPEHYEDMAKECDYMNKHLKLGAYMVNKADQHQELGSDLYHGGAVRPDIGGLHPALFHKGLLERVKAEDVSLHDQTTVTQLQTDKDGKTTVFTDKGQIKAQDVIVATNGYSNLHTSNWLKRFIIPIRSQIIATEELPTETMDRLFPKKRMHGTTLNLYNYFRPSPDGKSIIFGGRAGADRDDPLRSGKHLKKQLVDIFPELKEVNITHSWSGYTGYTFDYMPHLQSRDKVHYIGGYCGSGVVWAPWLGRLMALRILGKENCETAFAENPFQTKPLYNGTPWFLPPIIWWYAIKDKFGL